MKNFYNQIVPYVEIHIVDQNNLRYLRYCYCSLVQLFDYVVVGHRQYRNKLVERVERFMVQP